MTKQISTTDLLALSLVRSGQHTLDLESIHRYGLRLVTKLGQDTGERWTLLWGRRYLEAVTAPFVQVDDEVAELLVDTESLGNTLDGIDGAVIRAAEQTEWES